MNDFTRMITGDYGPLEIKGQIFVYGINDRVKASLDFIKSKYKNLQELNLAIDFIGCTHSESVKSDFEQLYRVGYFPSTETEMELDHAIKHALIGSYKSSFADLRRALELTVIMVYLTSEQVDKKKALDWVMSESDTPGFSKSLDKLIKQGRFKDLNDTYDWKHNLQHLYWNLSAYSHNKGQLKGYRELNNTNFFTSGTSAPLIKIETLESFCDLYIQTVKEIVVLLALYNPMILVGVPLDEKFGLNGPASGYFNESQAEQVHQLIPKDYKTYFENLAKNDMEIMSIVEHFNSLPDITEEEMKEQIKMQNDFFEKMNNEASIE